MAGNRSLSRFPSAVFFTNRASHRASTSSDAPFGRERKWKDCISSIWRRRGLSVRVHRQPCCGRHHFVRTAITAQAKATSAPIAPTFRIRIRFLQRHCLQTEGRSLRSRSRLLPHAEHVQTYVPYNTSPSMMSESAIAPKATSRFHGGRRAVSREFNDATCLSCRTSRQNAPAKCSIAGHLSARSHGVLRSNRSDSAGDAVLDGRVGRRMVAM
jgi:hypothetical protein